MRKTGILLSALFAAFLFALATSFLPNHPMNLFLLKERGDAVEAFKISAYLSGQETKMEALALSNEQKKRGRELLAQRSSGDLEVFSKNFGSYSAVIGMPAAEEGWPDYLGNGLKWMKDGMGQTVFDDLQWTDRIYLAFALRPPPPETGSETELSPIQAVANNATTASPAFPITPTPENHSQVVRVEILNGCGITNAAEWAAGRMKGAGISVIDSGNADNFQYPKTIIRTSGETSPALEEALGRLGLSKNSIQETPLSNPNVDVVVIVGKDFRQLKGRRHERNHHRAE